MKTDEDTIPYIGNHDLTWQMVRQGSDLSIDAFWCFWFLYTICAHHPDRQDRAQEFLDLAEHIANECPESWKGNTLVPQRKTYSPSSTHKRMVQLMENPSGLELWVRLICEAKRFGFFAAGIISRSCAIEGFMFNSVGVCINGSLNVIDQTRQLIVSVSPYAEASWITIKKEGVNLTITPVTCMPEQLTIPSLDTRTMGTWWIVLLPDGSYVQYFVPTHTEPPTYA